MRKAKIYFDLPEVFDINHTYVDGDLVIMDKYGQALMEIKIDREKVYPVEYEDIPIINEPVENISEE